MVFAHTSKVPELETLKKCTDLSQNRNPDVKKSCERNGQWTETEQNRNQNWAIARWAWTLAILKQLAIVAVHTTMKRCGMKRNANSERKTITCTGISICRRVWNCFVFDKFNISINVVFYYYYFFFWFFFSVPFWFHLRNSFWIYNLDFDLIRCDSVESYRVFFLFYVWYVAILSSSQMFNFEILEREREGEKKTERRENRIE